MDEPAATMVALALGAFVGLAGSVAVPSRGVRYARLVTILVGAAGAGLGHSLASGVGMKGVVGGGVSLGLAIVLVVLATTSDVLRGRDSTH